MTKTLNTYCYVTDYLGSVRTTYRITGENEAVPVQHISYMPSGAVIKDSHLSLQKRRFTGKELITMHGWNMYDSYARFQYRVMPRFSSIDPLCEKYYSTSPYAYCVNNPVRFIDPTGMEVEADELSRKNICNTLTKQEAKYIRFDKNGVLDTKRLNKSKSTSENMTALKALANSEIVYSFQVTSKDHDGNTYFDNSAIDGNYYRGTTEMPNAEHNSSPDNKVHVLIGSVLNEKQQVMTTAHEAFGHAFFYENSRNVEKASHTYKSEGKMIWDQELQMNVFEITKVPTNLLLEKQIKTVVKQAENNYNERNKK